MSEDKSHPDPENHLDSATEDSPLPDNAGRSHQNRQSPRGTTHHPNHSPHHHHLHQQQHHHQYERRHPHHRNHHGHRKRDDRSVGSDSTFVVPVSEENVQNEYYESLGSVSTFASVDASIDATESFSISLRNGVVPHGSKLDNGNEYREGRIKPSSSTPNPINSLIDWGSTPSVVQEEKVGLVGQKLPKPMGSFDPRDVAETAKKNRRRISSNIRRKKLVIWMLIFTLGLTWGGLSDLLQRLALENDNVFSTALMKPWLVPWLIFELFFTGIGVFCIILKMKYLQETCMKRTYHGIMSFNNIQYLVTLFVAIPFRYYFFFKELTNTMKDTMSRSSETEDTNPQWNITQITRRCCGFDQPSDWHNTDDKFADHDDNIPKDEIWYPISCCVDYKDLMMNSTLAIPCTAANNLWSRGCHDVEYNIILDYMLYVTGLVIFVICINVSIRLWIDRLERYLTVFRPREMFPK